jgi:hypothetical protein
VAMASGPGAQTMTSTSGNGAKAAARSGRRLRGTAALAAAPLAAQPMHA